MSHYMDAIIAALKLSHRAFTEGMKDVPAGVYCANYHNEKDVEIEFPAEANTMPKAVARAAYYVLTGKEWGG